MAGSRTGSGTNTSTNTGAGAHPTRWRAGGPSPNPAGRPRRERVSRADGWENLATSLGTTLDKRSRGAVRLDVISALTAQRLWRGNDVCKRCVELVPNHAVRRGITIKMEDRGAAEKLETALQSIPGPAHVGKGALRAVARALQYQRAYGGAALFPVINDAAGGLDQPLNVRRIQRIERLQLFEPRELWPLTYYRDPMHPKFGEVETWHLRPLAGNQPAPVTAIHESRLIVFPGIRVSRQHLAGSSPGWGDSIFTTLFAPINDFELVYGSAAALIQDFAQAVIKLKDLASVAGESPTDVTARLDFMNAMRSVLNAVVIDGDDTFERISTPITGLDAIMDRIANRVAMATGIPVTILMGQAPAGLNATGDADTRAFYDVCDMEREDATPMVESLIRLLMLSADGPTRGKEPDVWSVGWPALWTPTDKEIADTYAAISTADQAWVNMGAISPDDVASSHWPEGGDGFNPEIRIDWKARRAQASIESSWTAQPGGKPAPAPPVSDPDASKEPDVADPAEPVEPDEVA